MSVDRAHGPVAARSIDAEWLDTLATLIATSPVNLVSRADRSRVLEVHVDECLRVASAVRICAPSTWMDLGTGGGLPGLVLAAAYPDVAWTLLDARAKKVRLVEAFARALGLSNVTPVHGRAEDLGAAQPAAPFDGVISRAVGSLERTVALARPFVNDGQIIAIRGPRARAEVEQLRPWRARLGLSTVEATEVSGTIRPTWLVRITVQAPPPAATFPDARRELLRSTSGGSQ